MQQAERNRAVWELAFEVSRGWGRVQLRLYGTSMVPALWPGDIVTVEHRQTSELHRGEVAVCRANSGVLAHRILRVEGEMLILRGDSMELADPPVGKTQVLGVVAEVQRSGAKVSLARSPWKVLLSFLVRHSAMCKHAVLRLGHAQPFEQDEIGCLLW